MNPLWQQLPVYALVLWCLWRLLRKYAPGLSWRMQAKFSYFFECRRLPALKRLGRALRPAVAIPSGCASHCSACNRCA